VIPQAGHGLSGKSYVVNGDGQPNAVFNIPNTFDRLGTLIAWVERNEAPDKTMIVTSGERSMPMASYPNYPRYIGGPAERATSYQSTAP
jgi:feruloyl esterase